MKPSNTQAAMALSFLLLLVHPATANSPHIFRRAQMTKLGCYKSAASMQDQGPYTYQSSGWCEGVCTKLNKAVMATHAGSHCFCGDEIPADSDKTDDTDCNMRCNAWSENCGGLKAWTVYLTGLIDPADVPTAGAPSSSSITSQTAQTSQAGQTVTMSATSQPQSSGPNKAAIAAGVVVGVVALAALAGGTFFFMRYKKRKATELEYHRNAAVSNFIAGGKSYPTSSADSRLDRGLMEQRRQSNGSIADDQDFSRRILQVTNPDRY